MPQLIMPVDNLSAKSATPQYMESPVAQSTIDSTTLLGVLGKKSISNLAAIIFLVIAALTNPSEKRHQQAAASYFSKVVNDDPTSNILLGSSVDMFADMFSKIFSRIVITRQNYIFFSLTKNETNESTMGIGMFGYVWIFADISSVLNTQ
jgi:peptidoglycan hydrolase-like amidase